MEQPTILVYRLLCSLIRYKRYIISISTIYYRYTMLVWLNHTWCMIDVCAHWKMLINHYSKKFNAIYFKHSNYIDQNIWRIISILSSVWNIRYLFLMFNENILIEIIQRFYPISALNCYALEPEFLTTHEHVGVACNIEIYVHRTLLCYLYR